MIVCDSHWSWVCRTYFLTNNRFFFLSNLLCYHVSFQFGLQNKKYIYIKHTFIKTNSTHTNNHVCALCLCLSVCRWLLSGEWHILSNKSCWYIHGVWSKTQHICYYMMNIIYLQSQPCPMDRMHIFTRKRTFAHCNKQPPSTWKRKCLTKWNACALANRNRNAKPSWNVGAIHTYTHKHTKSRRPIENCETKLLFYHEYKIHGMSSVDGMMLMMVRRMNTMLMIICYLPVFAEHETRIRIVCENVWLSSRAWHVPGSCAVVSEFEWVCVYKKKFVLRTMLRFNPDFICQTIREHDVFSGAHQYFDITWATNGAPFHG